MSVCVCVCRLATACFSSFGPRVPSATSAYGCADVPRTGLLSVELFVYAKVVDDIEMSLDCLGFL